MRFLVVTFFVLNGQCWMTDGQQAINLANTFSIDAHGDHDAHIVGGGFAAHMNIKLSDLTKEMREQCATPGAGKAPSSP